MSGKATRAAFVVGGSGTGWMGGVNYFRNLFRALLSTDVGISPVALIRPGTDKSLATAGMQIECRAVAMTVPKSLAWWMRMALRESLGRDVLMDRLFREEQISVLSHSGTLGRSARTPTLAWVPDLQHKHYPQYFDAKEIDDRNRAQSRCAADATLLIASSESARNDLATHLPQAKDRIRVLRFVDCSSALEGVPSREELEKTYSFSGPFLYLPNQFWEHKNHRLVLHALKILAGRGTKVLVIATGNTADYRNPRAFPQLMHLCNELGVSDQFRVLGLVPYADVAGLLRHSMAVLNPSLFEGWSTTVEEAKSLGKRVLLSDISVHREQAPERGAYFPAGDPEALAELMWTTWEASDTAADERHREAALSKLADRRRAFAETYAAIVADAIKTHVEDR